jgi:hypothetical protein
MHDPLDSVKYSEGAGLTLFATIAVNTLGGTFFAVAKSRTKTARGLTFDDEGSLSGTSFV